MLALFILALIVIFAIGTGLLWTVIEVVEWVFIGLFRLFLYGIAAVIIIWIFFAIITSF